MLQVPKPPKKDFYKLMNKDKIVLRFSTRFVETPTHQLSSSDRYINLLTETPPGKTHAQSMLLLCYQTLCSIIIASPVHYQRITNALPASYQ